MTKTAIILAAGKGTRMKSDLPKVLHEVCGRPMVAYVIDACRQAGCDKLIIVIGHQADSVKDVFRSTDGDIAWVEQIEQLGTGHAVMACCGELESLSGPVIVLAGDGPLIRPTTLSELLETHMNTDAACTLASCITDDPSHYGRIVRDEDGELLGIVEYLDATDEQRQITEVNTSTYCFDAEALRKGLPQLGCDNAKGEYYLTDILAIMRSQGRTVKAIPVLKPEEAMSINTLDELQQVESIVAASSAEPKEQS